jgi:hypothetical protein
MSAFAKPRASKLNTSRSRALNWLIEQQQPNGLWRVLYVQSRAQEKETAKVRDMKLWISLAICRVFKRFAT